MIDLSSFSWLGVGLAAAALFVLGGVWYTVLFGKAYRTELGVGAEDAASPPDMTKALIGQLVAGVVMSAVLAVLIGRSSAAEGALIGAIAGVLVAAALVQLYQFEGRSVRHLLINVGYMVLGLTAAGAILGAFQAG